MVQSSNGDAEWFDPRPDDPPSSTLPFEGTNTCRITALALLLGGSTEAQQKLREELVTLGFSRAAITERVNSFDAFVSGVHTFAEEVPDPSGDGRERFWREFNSEGDPSRAVSFLICALGSQNQRESTAAAAVLWKLFERFFRIEYSRRSAEFGSFRWLGGEELRWPPYDGADELWEKLGGYPGGARTLISDYEYWPTLFAITSERIKFALQEGREGGMEAMAALVGARLALSARAQDSITRLMSLATIAEESQLSKGNPPQSSGGNPPLGGEGSSQGLDPLPSARSSIMIHGTWGWRGHWWRPGGDLHTFILNQRPALNVFKDGARFGWSGSIRAGDRRLAATELRDWVSGMAMDGLNTVFAHSLGGEVAALAMNDGLQIERLVLLSVPVNANVERSARTNAT